MITKSRLRYLIANDLVASIWITPVPGQSCWCIDAIIRTSQHAGCESEVIGHRPSSVSRRRLSTFPSIDEAANYLRCAGAKSFTVDLMEPHFAEAAALGDAKREANFERVPIQGVIADDMLSIIK